MKKNYKTKNFEFILHHPFQFHQFSKKVIVFVCGIKLNSINFLNLKILNQNKFSKFNQKTKIKKFKKFKMELPAKSMVLIEVRNFDFFVF